MSSISYREVCSATDIILGRRGGVLGNACYQEAIRRWAPQYAKTRITAKKQMLSQIYSYMTERGLRFLVQVGAGAGPGEDGAAYALVTDEYQAVQRIQRSLQEHNRRHAKADSLRAASGSSKASLAGESEGGESIGEEARGKESDGGPRLVTGNDTEARAGTPLPMLLERKSSAFTVSDTSIVEGLLNDDLYRQMTGYQLLERGQDATEHRPASNAATTTTTPHHAGPWPEIHLREKISDGIDAVSQITECSSTPEAPSRPSTSESAAVERTAESSRWHNLAPPPPPHVTSSSGYRAGPYGAYHEESRVERMMFGIRVEMQALRARVAAQEGELHVLRERVKMLEEH